MANYLATYMSAYIESQPHIIYVIRSIHVHAVMHDILFTVTHEAVLLTERFN